VSDVNEEEDRMKCGEVKYWLSNEELWQLGKGVCLRLFVVIRNIGEKELLGGIICFHS
jgi:hypothetical protein